MSIKTHSVVEGFVVTIVIKSLKPPLVLMDSRTILYV